jgi:hypothetical protein
MKALVTLSSEHPRATCKTCLAARNLSVTFASVECMIETQIRRPDATTLLTLDPGLLDETQALQVIHTASQLQARIEALRLRVVNRYSCLYEARATL